MISVIEMHKQHLDQVVSIENSCFNTPWTKTSFLKEIETNKFALYFVAINDQDNKVLGYGGMWHVINEGHITNIAVSPAYRNQGVASKILNKLIQVAKEKQMIGLTLEVRVSNNIAKNLYIKHGFILEGLRKEYYEDNREDALIMWKYI